MKIPSAVLPIVLATVFLGGCVAHAPDGSDRGAEADSSLIIAERGPPRERARIHTELAAAYYERGNLAVALEEIRIAIAADPSYAPAYNVLGLLHADLKENDQAQLSFERALRLSPNDADINHNYGWFLCQAGREDQSLKYFQAAVRNPLYATPQKTYVVAATCALGKARQSEALDFFERALKFDPVYLPAIMGMANLKFRMGELIDSRNLVARFHKLVEPNAESLWLGLRIERKLGNKAAESNLAARLRRQFPNSPEYLDFQNGRFD
jgi:type IV pilus assembly protein PilF